MSMEVFKLQDTQKLWEQACKMSKTKLFFHRTAEGAGERQTA